MGLFKSITESIVNSIRESREPQKRMTKVEANEQYAKLIEEGKVPDPMQPWNDAWYSQYLTSGAADNKTEYAEPTERGEQQYWWHDGFSGTPQERSAYYYEQEQSWKAEKAAWEPTLPDVDTDVDTDTGDASMDA